MAPVHILIVGCGIAGPTLASLLLLTDLPASQKPHITIIERSSELKAHTQGQNIDIRGAGVTIMRKLGLETLIRSSTTGEEGVQIVDERNYVWGSNTVDKTGRIQSPTSDIEILRGRLAELCWKNSHRVSSEVERQGGKAIEYVFGDFVDQLDQDGDKVHVIFSKSRQSRTYDIVVGADGLQSRTRRMVWGADGEQDRIKRLGMYMGFFSIPRGRNDSNWRRWFHAPGRRSVMLRPDGKGVKTTVVMSVVNDSDPRFVEVAAKGRDGVTAQKLLLQEYFRDAGWECDRVVRDMMVTEDFYYDMVAQIKMDKWSKGRVVLLGDAGYCASPISGMGTTLAFVGAYNLAGALRHYLQDSAGDVSAAFADYEAKMKPTIEAAQKLAPGQLKIMAPETAFGITALHIFVHLLSWTRVFLFAIMFLRRFISVGPQAADFVPVEDYGFQKLPELPDWKEEEIKDNAYSE